MKTFVTHHLPAIVWGMAILAVSSIPHLKAPEVGFWATDKLAHILEYAGFAFLSHRSLARLSRSGGRPVRFRPTFILVALLALVDETLQSFIPGRTPDPLDYLADLGGGLAVVVLLWLTAGRQRRPRTGSGAGRG